MGIGTSIVRLIAEHQRRAWLARPNALGDFYRAGGNDLLLRDSPLSSEDLVLDVGAYEGDFSKQVCWRFGARCVAVEPVPAYCTALRALFRGNSRVRIVEAALGASNGSLKLWLAGDGTSAFARRSATAIQARMIDVAELVPQHAPIGLLKLNIEGGEYDVLDRLLASSLVTGIRSLLIQFHLVEPDSESRRDRIRAGLAESHREVFCHPFVWERWDRR